MDKYSSIVQNVLIRFYWILLILEMLIFFFAVIQPGHDKTKTAKKKKKRGAALVLSRQISGKIASSSRLLRDQFWALLMAFGA